MDLKLTEKTAFVSGSTSGIGFSIALGLAKEGAKTYINGPSQTLVDQALHTIKKDKLKIYGISADLSTITGAQSVIEQLPKIDILINNLGIYEPQDFFSLKDEDWSRTIEINVMSGIRLSRHYLKTMLQKNWGRIIFISSESGIMIPKEMIHYGVTKTMQIALASGLAKLTKNSQVTVNSILAGPTRTPGIEKFISNLAKEWKIPKNQVEKEYFLKVRTGSLINRFALPEEVANLAVYLSSPLSSCTNGATLRGDGGIIKSII
ncbi:short-chain dehydrogenase/reductase [Legionella lansingensis]|uniref:Short-chain dehydrogenase/reductase n=1 Tax=Legionella lansingensis TaxID=45067 RepID=A0A0W0VUD9_9GAMM|nr:SDR family oxidoreductase [Legionella lansingensis]KTD23815.1 short-chain dehydrogenase/reductase [Legionella lansingensis]SNV46883.1 short-chain dehydrogenase/reductase [Legionella lansingensis]